MMRNGKEREIKGIYAAVLMVFLVFLLIPILLPSGENPLRGAADLRWPDMEKF